VAEAIVMGKAAAQLVTTKFPNPIKLEFEKVYYPWLLMAKKKYAGLFWTKAEKWDKVDCKGIESVRRDNCGIVRYVVDTVLQRILIQQDVASAIEFCKGVISEILQNKVDLSLLIITKAYSRDADAYKNPQAHIALAQRMAKRNPATAPKVGDRIPYVIVRGEKKAKMCDKAEDPLYVLENDVPIDSQYYIEQLISPVCRLFRPMVDNPEALLTTGEHTRHIVIPRSTNTGGSAANKGGLAAFVVVKEHCMGCRAPLSAGEKTLCKACMEHMTDIYARYMNDGREKEMQFSRLWTHCQNCQGSMHLEVICVANDCPIFYKRTKVYKEHVEAQRALAKFNDLSW
jgi:DNA polymerase delta subunit 1